MLSRQHLRYGAWSTCMVPCVHAHTANATFAGHSVAALELKPKGSHHAALMERGPDGSTIALGSPPSAFPSRAQRQATIARRLAVLVGLAGLLPSRCVQSPHLRMFGSAHIDLDNSVRAVAQGFFNFSGTVPVTIVDIDETTQAGWHHPVVTPRLDLMRMISVVEAAKPAAIVADIDVSWSGETAGGPQFRTFLANYRGPAPLIFPKRLLLGADGFRHPVVASLDDVFRSNSKLSWAHAEFVTGTGGAVRTWDEWVPVCLTDGPAWLPSVEMAVMLHARTPLDIRSSGPPPLPATCAFAKPVANRLILGPRMTGPERGVTGTYGRAVSAAMLLDPAIARDDSSLFTGRVVLIGATHADGGDLWLTPAGLIPGVELLASTILYAPLKPADGMLAESVRTIAGVLLFLVFVATIWFFKGAARPIMLVAIGLLTTFTAVKLGWFGFLDALEKALLLTLVYEAIRLLLESAMDFRDGWREYGSEHQAKTAKARIGHAIKNAFWRNTEPSGAD